MFAIYNFIRYLVLLIDFLVLTFAFFFCSFLPRSFTSTFFPFLYQNWSLRFFRLFGVKEHLHQKYNNNLPKQFILISNHPSGIELMWLPSRFKVIPLAKEEIQNWFVVGRITKSLGTVFVNRKDKDSRHAASASLLEAVKKGKNIMIFPEGGCYGKNIQPFFMGAFHLSKQTGIPILPVYLHYEEANTYYWGDYGLLKFMWRALVLPKNRNAHLYIFDPVLPESFASEQAMHDRLYEFYLAAEKKYS